MDWLRKMLKRKYGKKVREKLKKMDKKNLQKIAIVAIILLLIGGVWVAKNREVVFERDVAEGEVQISDAGQETGSEQNDGAANDEDVEGYFPLHVTDTIDLGELKSYGLPIIIDFGADSCIPCKEMAPVLEKLNEELKGKAIVLFVDVWKYGELAADFPVQVIPTQILIDAEGNPYTPSENVSVEYTQYTYRETGELAFTVHQGGITEEQLMEALAEMGVEADD